MSDRRRAGQRGWPASRARGMAWEELTGGVNGVRRAIGAAGLVYVVARVGAALER